MTVQVDYRVDMSIMPAVTRLFECFCAEMAASKLDLSCPCQLVHGSVDSVSWPEPGSGTAWLGVAQVFPSMSFPSPDAGLLRTSGSLAASLTMGVIRCYQVDRTGEAKESAAKLLDLQMADMAAMHRAMVCCAKDDGISISIGSYTPIGPIGSTYGGQWSLTIQEDR